MSTTLSSLLSQSSLDDDEEILKAANEILKKSKSDKEAQHVRAVALLKLDRHDDALRAFEAGGDSVQRDAPLEYAYALYKNGRLEDADRVASEGGVTRGLKHIQAQVNYRLERFAKTRRLYSELANSAGDEEGDLRTNGGATDAQLAWSGQSSLAAKNKADREDMQLFYAAFNAACGYIARGELQQAITLLTRAKDLCNASDELSEDEKTAELLPILIQQVYVLSKLGRLDEATKLASNMAISSIPDLGTKHIAQANKLALSPNIENPFLAHLEFQSGSKIPAKDKPFKFQSSILQRNAFTLDLRVGKSPNSGTSQTSDGPSIDISSPSITVGVFKAAAKAHSQTGKTDIRQIMPLLEKNPKDLGLLLTIVHLYLLTNNTHMAASLLDQFLTRLELSSSPEDQDVRYAPGLVALQVTINAELNRSLHTKQELAKAASYWRHRERSRTEDSNDSSSLLAAAGLTLLDMPTSEERTAAREIFEHLSEQGTKSKIASAGLAATSEDDTDETTLEKQLPTISELTSGIDASALEAAGIAKAPSALTQSGSKKRPNADADTKTSRPKKIRRSRMPKDFDPNKKMDKERWLPLRDRSTYRPKGKKKGKAQGMVTQGGLVSDDSRPATPSQIVQQPAKGKGKKKGHK